MGKQSVLLVIWTVLQLSGSILGLCPGAADQPQYVFVGQGKECDGNHPFLLPGSPLSPMASCTKCCKSFLSCLPTGLPSGDGPPFQCVEVAQHSPCNSTPELSNPCGPYLACLPSLTSNNSLCLAPALLENGATCLAHGQCASGHCLTPDEGPLVCGTPSGLPEGTCSRHSDCPEQRWCHGGSFRCMSPLPLGADCSAAVDGPDLEPSSLCASGSACAPLGNGSRACVAYYSQGEEGACTRGSWWNCRYSYFCDQPDGINPEPVGEREHSSRGPSEFNGGVDEEGRNGEVTPLGRCRLGVRKKLPGLPCSKVAFSTADLQECRWSQACDCSFADEAQEVAGQCRRIFNEGCLIRLQALTECLQQHSCPHSPAQLLGGSHLPLTGGLVAGSCVETKCAVQHADLVKCENFFADDSPSSPAYIPLASPNARYSTPPSRDIQPWEYGVLFAGSIFVATTIALIVWSYLKLQREIKSRHGPIARPLISDEPLTVEIS